VVIMTGDRGIRRLTAAAVLLVAAIAALVSFIHIEHLAITHGQTQLAAWLLPVSVDGTVGAASLSMLWAARSGLSTPWLSRCMLTLGVLATLAANIGYGAPHGLSGELLSGWPAVAFVGSVEMVLAMVRRARATSAPSTVPGVLAAGNGAPAHLIEAQRIFADEIAGHKVPTIRAIRAGLSVGAAKAAEAQRHLAVLAGSGGHG
jgi:Protein of unknown function (DUF2637)